MQVEMEGVEMEGIEVEMEVGMKASTADRCQQTRQVMDCILVLYVSLVTLKLVCQCWGLIGKWRDLVIPLAISGQTSDANKHTA